MIGAGGVPAYTHSPYDLSFRVVKRKTTAEHDSSSDGLAHKGVIRLAEVFGLPGKDGVRVWRSRHVDAVETLPGLRCCIEVRCGKCRIGLTERVCGVGLFGSNQPASRPLR